MKKLFTLMVAVVATMAGSLLAVAPAGAVKKPQERIVGGDDADIAAWPYLVAIREDDSESFCGGSLVRPNVVLTAAHCVISDSGDYEDSSNWEIVAGRTDLTNTAAGDEVAVADTVAHPYYDPATAAYDAALLLLTRAVDSSVVSNADLVSVDTGTPGWSVGDTVFSAGWGTTSSGGFQSQDQLKQVQMETLADADCQGALGSDYDPGSMMCAGAPDFTTKDTCQGDSGGPLVKAPSADPADDVQVGVISWGNGCAAGDPGAYTYLAAPDIQRFLADPTWDGSTGGGGGGGGATPGTPTTPTTPTVSAACKSATSKFRKARKKLRKAKAKYKRAKKAYKRKRSTRNRKRLRKAKKAYKKAKKAYSRAKRLRASAC